MLLFPHPGGKFMDRRKDALQSRRRCKDLEALVGLGEEKVSRNVFTGSLFNSPVLLLGGL